MAIHQSDFKTSQVYAQSESGTMCAMDCLAHCGPTFIIWLIEWFSQGFEISQVYAQSESGTMCAMDCLAHCGPTFIIWLNGLAKGLKSVRCMHSQKVGPCVPWIA